MRKEYNFDELEPRQNPIVCDIPLSIVIDKRTFDYCAKIAKKTKRTVEQVAAWRLRLEMAANEDTTPPSAAPKRRQTRARIDRSGLRRDER